MGIILDFDAAGPVLRRTDSDQIAKYTVGAHAHFALDAQWDGRTITAAWESDGATTATGPMPVTDGTCEIPWETVRGMWTKVFLTGTLSADDVLTTNSAIVWVLQNSSISATPPEQPTQTLYDQMVAYAATIDQQSTTAAQAATSAATSAQTSEQAATSAEQSLTQMQGNIGVTIASLVDGKLNPAQVPFVSIIDTFTVTSIAEMVQLNAQKGDNARIVANGVITDCYSLGSDDPTVLANWVKWGTGWVPEAGHAGGADTANDSDKVDGKHLWSGTQAEYDALTVKDVNTLYFVSAS